KLPPAGSCADSAPAGALGGCPALGWQPRAPNSSTAAQVYKQVRFLIFPSLNRPFRVARGRMLEPRGASYRFLVIAQIDKRQPAQRTPINSAACELKIVDPDIEVAALVVDLKLDTVDRTAI